MFLVTASLKACRGSILLAHGSGAPMDSPFMDRAAHTLARAGLDVYRYEFAYMARRRQTQKRPPPSRFATLQDELRQLYAHWEAPPPHFLGGKSLGSRVSFSLLNELPVQGGVALGYPFHPPARPDNTRLQPFESLRRPTLIFQGTRDPFGRPSEVDGYRLGEACQVVWLEGANHDFAVTRGHPDPFVRVESALGDWLAALSGGKLPL